MKRQPWLRLAAGAAALSLTAAACGDGGGGTESGGDGSENGGGDGEAGAPAEVAGFDGETITLGALTPTTGTVEIIGTPLTAGNQAYVDYVNEELGGVAGEYELELEVVDSAYDPSLASQEYPDMRDNVVMFMQILGTAVVDALLGDLESDNVVAGPATLDSFWVHEPNLMPIGAPYQIQAINALDWYYSSEGGEDEVLCALASDDAYGDTGVEGVNFAAEDLGIDVAAEVTFPAPSAERPEQNFGAQISELESADCDVVFFTATATDTSGFADALDQNPDFSPTVLGQSPTWLGLFAENPEMQENWYIIAEGPAWGDEDHEGMAEVMRIFEEYAPDDQNPDIYFNFGVNQARATVQILEQAVENGDLSREGIMTAMEEVGTLEFDGLQGDYVYGPAEEREPPTTNSIFRPNPEFGGENGTGLELVEQDYESDVAGDFDFSG